MARSDGARPVAALDVVSSMFARCAVANARHLAS